MFLNISNKVRNNQHFFGFILKVNFFRITTATQNAYAFFSLHDAKS